jgi:hypothetical protein
MAQQMRYLRPCKHPNDMVIFGVTLDGKVLLYCLGCLMDKIGLEPCETLTIEDFTKKYGPRKE